MTKQIGISFVALLLSLTGVRAGVKPPDVLGLRLRMSEDAVRSRLRKIGKQQKEEKENEGEGEQEVWILEHHRRFDYLVTRFDSHHRLSFVTAVVRKDARIRYNKVAALQDARYATDGRNHTYTWTIAASGKKAGYLLVVRGSDPEFVTSYSLYPLRQGQSHPR